MANVTITENDLWFKMTSTDYFLIKSRVTTLQDLLLTFEDVDPENPDLEYEQLMEPDYNTALAFATGFLTDVNIKLVENGQNGFKRITKNKTGYFSRFFESASSSESEDNTNTTRNCSREEDSGICTETSHNNNMGKVDSSLESEQSFKIFKCHKLILSLSSPVFHEMFYDEAGELIKQVSSQDVLINDSNPTAFGILLKFIYAKLFPMNLKINQLIDLYYLAYKFNIQELEKLIHKQFGLKLDVKSTLLLLKTAKTYGLTSLEEKCWDNIDKFIIDVIQSDPDNWAGLDKELICAILERRGLQIEEGQLFKFTIDWAKAQYKQIHGNSASVGPAEVRQILGDALYKFAFAGMTCTDFAIGPASTGILTDSEMVSVFMYICTKDVPEFEGSHNEKLAFPTFKRNDGSEIASASEGDGVRIPEIPFAPVFNNKPTLSISTTSKSVPKKVSNLKLASSVSATTTAEAAANEIIQSLKSIEEQFCACHQRSEKLNCFFCCEVEPYRKFREQNQGSQLFALFDQSLGFNDRWIYDRTPQSYCICRQNNRCPIGSQMIPSL